MRSLKSVDDDNNRQPETKKNGPDGIDPYKHKPQIARQQPLRTHLLQEDLTKVNLINGLRTRAKVY